MENEKKLREIIKKNFSRYHASFTITGDLYHDDFEISQGVVIENIIKEYKDGLENH